MKKLSEFEGQEHITSVLRASVIKKEIISKFSITGTDYIASEIACAYHKSLCCSQHNRGDACEDCANCATYWAFIPRQFRFYSQWTENVVNFQLKTAAGTYIDSEILELLVYSYQSEKADVIQQIKKIAQNNSLQQFLTKYVEIFVNILYLKNNIEVKETEHLDALQAFAVRISVFAVNACIRLLWDAQQRTTLPDTLSIEIVSLLISEALKPTPVPEVNEIWAEDGSKPIKVIESNNLEPPLTLEKMLELARS